MKLASASPIVYPLPSPPFIFRSFVVIAVCAVLTACSEGYVRSNGTTVWKTVNEGTGTQYHDIEGIDGNSFVKLAYPYGKDAHNVYYNGSILPDADPATFRLLSKDYGKDATYPFYHMLTVRGADVATFRVLGNSGYASSYARDSRTIFHQDQAIDTCDPDSFVILNGWWAKDERCVYETALFPLKDKRVEGADAATFQALDDIYGKDVTNVFVRGRGKIPNADAATFRVISFGKGRDKSGCYREESAVPC